MEATRTNTTRAHSLVLNHSQDYRFLDCLAWLSTNCTYCLNHMIWVGTHLPVAIPRSAARFELLHAFLWRHPTANLPAKCSAKNSVTEDFIIHMVIKKDKNYWCWLLLSTILLPHTNIDCGHSTRRNPLNQSSPVPCLALLVGNMLKTRQRSTWNIAMVPTAVAK